MGGAIHPLPQYAFMVWCLVKAQGQLYLYIHPNHVPAIKRLLLRSQFVVRFRPATFNDVVSYFRGIS
jgi:hypothetical protein